MVGVYVVLVDQMSAGIGEGSQCDWYMDVYIASKLEEYVMNSELHPAIEAILRQISASPAPPIEALTPEQARGIINPFLMAIVQGAEDVASVEDATISVNGGDIGMRIYKPSRANNLPVLVYYHGGGWVVGNIDTHDSTCRALANGAGCVVISVDYRLAPEHTFPTAANDAYEALLWIVENSTTLGIDKSHIAVGGDSAGGNLAAVVALMARDKNGPKLSLQLLVYPVTDISAFETDSYKDFADSFILTKTAMQWFSRQYAPNHSDRSNAYASPLLASDLTGVAPACIIAAKLDVLFDDGKAYADKLKNSGVAVEYQAYDGVIHLFYGMGCMSPSENGISQSVAALKRCFELP